MEITSRFDRSNIRMISLLVRTHQIDIVNAQSTRDRYTSILAKWINHLNCKVIHTRRQLSKSQRLAGKFYQLGTDKIVAVSEGVKQSLVTSGINRRHIHVIHNGTPPEKYSHIDPTRVKALRTKYRIAKSEVVIGSVSRLKEQRQILAALIPLKQPIKVIFVGIDGQSSYDAIVQKFVVPHQIIYTGTISNEEVLHHYPLFTMNILASLIEGLSQSLLEAMALGTPVIATKIGGNPELIQHNVNGLLFDNNDIAALTKHIEVLIGNPGLRRRLAAKAKVTALTDFSLTKTVERYEAFFRSFLKDA
jgi:glycosyltransferase involved in cell wall biosynthesis